MAGYGGYDQAQLDAQYNLRERHPDFEQHMSWYERESALTRQRLECRLDVPYGAGSPDDRPLQRLDAFPARAAGSPLSIFIHGGYWQFLDKAPFSFPAASLVEAGAAVVSLNYTLAPEARIGEMVDEVRQAVAWCHANAASLKADASRLYVCGHSAGGHLATMLLVTDWAAQGLPRDVLKGGCTLSGVYDLDAVRHSYLAPPLRLDADSARALNPVLQVPPQAPPLIAVVGGDESAEFLRNNAELAAAWRGQGLPCEEMQVPGTNHYTVVQELAKPRSPVTRAMQAQMGLG